ncbi:MAG: NADPH:quinone oxidoreductase family protein [Candidatus Promineifilaceae bacterium]
MKAIICQQFGPPETVVYTDLPDLTPQAGEVKIRIRACGVNFADTLMIQGQYQVKPPFPFIPGMEIAGEIAAIGEGVRHLKLGDRVVAIPGTGGFAEEIVVSAALVLPVPERMAWGDAAAFAIAYGTSHIALNHRGHLQPGETLLVHGAAGGVGLTAVEIGKLMGATVIATASTSEKLAIARQYGADYVINYREENFVEQVKAFTQGRGANVIYDPVGGDVFDQSLRCIAWEGRLLVIGFASGRIPQIPANLTLVKNCSVVGVYWGNYTQKDPDTLRQSLRTLLGWYEQGQIKPHIAYRFPLGRTGEALRVLMDRRAMGKVVVEMND